MEQVKLVVQQRDDTGSRNARRLRKQGLVPGVLYGSGKPASAIVVGGSIGGLTTALLLRDHAGSPADLKDQVASPGGTTIAALASLEDAAVRGAYIRAVQRTAVAIARAISSRLCPP